MFKRAIQEIDEVPCMDLYCGSRTSQPPLIIQFMVPVIADHLRPEFISIRQIHAGLQRDVSLKGRTHPSGISESKIIKADILHRPVECTFYPDQSLQCRNNYFRPAHIFTGTWIIIYLTGINIMKPFSLFV